MRYIILSAVLTFLITSCSVQKQSTNSFEGKLVYSVSSEYNNPDKSDSVNYQIVYAQDSMVRIESFTPIGKQVYIKHIPKKKAYILMDLHLKKVAIQTHTDTIDRSDKYSFEHKFGSETFAGQKAKNIKVTNHEQDTTMVMNYLPDISPKYTDAIEGIPGLPAKYSVFSSGLWIHYELISFETMDLSKDLFGIPSNYEIITLDEFMEMITN